MCSEGESFNPRLIQKTFTFKKHDGTHALMVSVPEVVNLWTIMLLAVVLFSFYVTYFCMCESRFLVRSMGCTSGPVLWFWPSMCGPRERKCREKTYSRLSSTF